MTQLNYLKETASQTAGPYVHIGLAPSQAGFDIFVNNFGANLVAPETLGERITIEGRVFDGAGEVMRDVLLEIWQANAAGRYASATDTQAKPLDPAFRGWGRGCTDFDSGLYSFETIKPGAVTNPNGKTSAPHVDVWIVARGMNIGLHTRLYFADEVAANVADPVLNGIEWSTRRPTLIAQRSERDGKVIYTFNIVIQGSNATVFFDI